MGSTLTGTAPPKTVHLLGSWDNFTTAYAMEQDCRVGRGVWKVMLSDKGGLEMGAVYQYYFLIDSKHLMPDPCSTPDLTTVNPKTGRLMSIIHVPMLLPPGSENPPAPPPHVYLPRRVDTNFKRDQRESFITNATSFFQSGDDVAEKSFEDPRKVPAQPRPIIQPKPYFSSSNLKDKFKVTGARRISSGFFALEKDNSAEEDTGKKKRWSIGRKTSGLFRPRNGVRPGDAERANAIINAAVDKYSEEDEELLDTPRGAAVAAQQRSIPPPGIEDVAGYLRQPAKLSINTNIRQTDARAYYHSPVAHSAYSSSSRLQHSKLTLPRTVSDASQLSKEAPSLSYSVTTCSCNSKMACSCSIHGRQRSSRAGSDSEEEPFEVDTPIDGLNSMPTQQVNRKGHVYPKFYNFDELSGVSGGNRDIGPYVGDVIVPAHGNLPMEGVKPLGCLREEIAHELAWRDELVGEWGYLGRVV
ncbi:hypothetical protein RUND412_007599 [Rhizina undulata]